MLSVAVVTATTGNARLLEQCCRSIDSQTYKNWNHYLFYDGVVSFSQFSADVQRSSSEKRHLAYWPGRIGGPGLEGRRIYAAAPSLINEDVTIILNEDDWFMPEHIETLVEVLNRGNDWAHSLRRIYSKEGEYLFNDDCESLGAHPIFHDSKSHLVETCSYAVRTPIMCNVAAVYNYRGFGPDRLQYDFLYKNYPKFGCTGKYTMCFRLGGNPNSVTKEFFENGNSIMKLRYPGGFPWAK